MTTLNEKFVAANKNGVRAGFQLIEIMFESMEKLALLNAEAAKVLVQEGLSNLQGLVSSKDYGVSDLKAGSWPMVTTERIVGYSRNAYEIAADSGTRIGEVMEQRLLQTSQELEEWVDEALTASPFGQSEVAASATKAALTNVRAVIEQISQAARQAAGYADSSVKAAAQGVAR